MWFCYEIIWRLCETVKIRVRMLVVDAVRAGDTHLEGVYLVVVPRERVYLERLTVGCLQFVFFHS